MIFFRFKTLVLCMIGGISISVSAQSKLDEYVQFAIDSNIVLKQKQIQYDKAIVTLQSAKNNFLPSVNFTGNYTSAKGGRYSTLPLGDMLNPVYATLNQMTGSNAFPQIANQQINFLPHNFYDAYVRTAVPIYNRDLLLNKKIHEQRIKLTELEISMYARELVKEVKVAYFNYVMTTELVDIYESNLKVIQKNIEFHKALIREGKGLQVNLLRAETEEYKMNSILNEAKSNVENARAYFNFLLNRAQDTPVELTSNQLVESQPTEKRREELQLLDQVSTIQNTVLTMNKSYWQPKLNAYLDLGSQASNWEFSNKSAYYMVGVSTSIPIYNGNKNKLQIKQTLLDIQNTELQQADLINKIELSQNVAQRNVASAKLNWMTAQQQFKTAENYFQLINSVSKEGLLNQLEFIDATNQLSQAEVNISIQFQKYQIALTELERVNASYPISIK